MASPMGKKPKPTGEKKKLAGLRNRAERIGKNVRFQRDIRRAKDRATMQVERDRLHGLLYEQISPGLRERVMTRGAALDQLLDEIKTL